MSINALVKSKIRQRANYLCEYCHSSEEASTSQFTIDHLQPKSRQGTDALTNLALACHRCNIRRYNFTTGIDPTTQSITPLFNPRIHKWSEQFSWSSDSLRIIGVNAIGRATCLRLDMNDDSHDEGAIIKARRLWLRGGWHPPKSDPIQL
ncbi:MAG: HNH endonuclease signature motif containing protein [Cyanobacteria bacterium P01_A01_bin.116]